MRVTLSMMTSRVLDDLMVSSERLLEAQNRASSGKRIRRPSDDVSGTGLAMNLRETLSEFKQFERNGDVAKSLLTATSHYLNSIAEMLEEARSLALSAANPAVTDEARSAIALQLDQISSALAAAGNAQYAGKYLFAGSQTKTPPLVPSGVESPPYSYQGDSEEFRLQVAPGTYISSNVTGDGLFNIGGASVPGAPDIFETLRLLKQEITAGDSLAISSRIADIDANLNNVIATESQVGAKLNRLDNITGTVLDSQLVFKELLTKTEDVDLAEAILELRTRENVYQAAIATASRVLQMSLADYLE